MRLLLLTMLAALPTAALAQQVPAVAPPYHPAIDNPPVAQAFARPSALNGVASTRERYDAAFGAAYFDRQMAHWRATHNPRRVRRAEAAADLINNGDCDGARALAVRDSDERMIDRIEQVCALIDVSSPTAAATGR